MHARIHSAKRKTIFGVKFILVAYRPDSRAHTREEQRTTANSHEYKKEDIKLAIDFCKFPADSIISLLCVHKRVHSSASGATTEDPTYWLLHSVMNALMIFLISVYKWLWTELMFLSSSRHRCVFFSPFLFSLLVFPINLIFKIRTESKLQIHFSLKLRIYIYLCCTYVRRSVFSLFFLCAMCVFNSSFKCPKNSNCRNIWWMRVVDNLCEADASSVTSNFIDYIWFRFIFLWLVHFTFPFQFLFRKWMNAMFERNPVKKKNSVKQISNVIVMKKDRKWY